MASDQLIDAHLAALAARLPDSIVDELADGLTETWHGYLKAGKPPGAAARAAVEEFGAPQQIIEAFVAQSPGRRLAQRLLVTGPIVGVCWAATFITTRAWTWPIHPAAAAVFGFVVVAAIAALVASTCSRHSYRLARIGGTTGGFGAIIVDSTLLATLLLIDVDPSLALVVAIPASLIRLTLILRLLPALRTP